MLDAGARRSLIHAALTACLGYGLALHLIVAAMAGGAQAARSLDAFALHPHAPCMAGAASGGPERRGSTPASPHRDDGCCTLACGVALHAPHAIVIAVAYRTVALAVIQATVALSARPETASPGLGRGPRAPPSRPV